MQGDLVVPMLAFCMQASALQSRIDEVKIECEELGNANVACMGKPITFAAVA